MLAEQKAQEEPAAAIAVPTADEIANRVVEIMNEQTAEEEPEEEYEAEELEETPAMPTAEEIATRVVELMNEQTADEEEPAEEEYEEEDDGVADLAAQIAERLKEEDFTQKIAFDTAGLTEEIINRLKEDGFTEMVTERLIHEGIAQNVELDTDELVAKLIEKLQAEGFTDRIAAQLKEETLGGEEEKFDSEALVEKLVERMKEEGFMQTAEFDSEALVQTIVERLTAEGFGQGVDFDTHTLSAHLVEQLKSEGFVQNSELDSEEMVAKITDRLKEDGFVQNVEFDSEEIIEKIVEQMKEEGFGRKAEVDTDEVAEKVTDKFTTSEEFVKRVAEYLKTDATFLATLKREETRREELAAAVVQPAPAPAPAPAPEQKVVREVIIVKEPEEEEPEEEDEEEEPLTVTSILSSKPKAPARKPAKPMTKQPAEPELTTRVKRSFTAKLIESEEDVKEYYSELKNEFLSYTKVASQLNWSNDRFTYKRETIAKICVRGRTLCLYLALNPDEFPESVYHQKFAGDTKMYEKTPMMIKIKSVVALKRAMRLVELLMERLQAIREEKPHVDYTLQFAYRNEQQLIAEGLVKTAIVEKSDLDF